MGLKERMQGDPDEWYYTAAWGLLELNSDFEVLKSKMPAEFIQKTIKAVEVIRKNRPEYREVFIKGIDDAK